MWAGVAASFKEVVNDGAVEGIRSFDDVEQDGLVIDKLEEANQFSNVDPEELSLCDCDTISSSS